MRGIAKWHVFISNEAFLVAKSALGPHGAKPPNIHMMQQKSANFSNQEFSVKSESDWV